MSFLLSSPHTPLSLAFSLWLFAVHLLVMARAVTRADRTPASRVAWVAVIAFLPLLGVVAYFFLGETSIGRDRIKNLRRAQDRTESPNVAACPQSSIPPHTASLFDLGRSINGFAPTAGNRIVLLGASHAAVNEPGADSDAAIQSLLRDIAQAREHVHISFYIWLDDHNGGKVTDALCAAAARGVQCRVMVDALGSRAFIRSPRWKQLRDAHVRTLASLNDIPRLRHLAIGRMDLRNHRKIVVIDNRIAYCGSQNCADPQFRVQPKFAPWIDMLLRCEGPVARQAQYLFVTAWIAESGESLEALPGAAPLPASFQSGAIAQMFGTGPTTQGNAMSDMFVAALYSAQHELIITTPYFVPDEAIMRALCAAPRRGVDTTIIFPARNNSRMVGNTCRSNYLDLLSNAVRVYEYPLGLLHTKSLTMDGKATLVGSANMDRRSLQLNFENNVLIADDVTTAAIRERQLGYLAVSHSIGIDQVRAWPFRKQLVQDAVGMMAPLL